MVKKDDFNLSIPVMITMFGRVVRKRIAKDIRILSSQSGRAFNAIPCFSIH